MSDSKSYVPYTAVYDFEVHIYGRQKFDFHKIIKTTILAIISISMNFNFYSKNRLVSVLEFICLREILIIYMCSVKVNFTFSAVGDVLFSHIFYIQVMLTMAKVHSIKFFGQIAEPTNFYKQLFIILMSCKNLQIKTDKIVFYF